MSTAWRGAEVLWREPWSAVITRLARRAILPVIGIGLAGVPGTGWHGLVHGAWLRMPLLVIGVLALLFWARAGVNVARGRRVLLVVMGTGSIERPRSLQETWLKRPQEFAIGRTVTVTVGHPPIAPSPSEPRVTLSGEGSVGRIPLFGTAPEDFVAKANAILRSRGVTLVLAPPPVPE